MENYELVQIGRDYAESVIIEEFETFDELIELDRDFLMDRLIESVDGSEHVIYYHHAWKVARHFDDYVGDLSYLDLSKSDKDKSLNDIMMIAAFHTLNAVASIELDRMLTTIKKIDEDLTQAEVLDIIKELPDALKRNILDVFGD